VSRLSPRALLRAVYRHVDLDGLLAEHPHLTRQDVDDLFMRLVEALDGAPARSEKPLPPGSLPPVAPAPAGTDVDVVVHTDGSSRGNPGPAGIGVVLVHPDGTILREVSRAIGRATNNVAEYRAAIAGVEAAARLGARRVLLRSDSELLVRQLRGEYRVRNPDLKALHARLMRAVEGFEHFACEHVGREANARADALAAAASRPPTRRPTGRQPRRP